MTCLYVAIGFVVAVLLVWLGILALRRHERELDAESDSEWMDRQK